MYVHALAVSVRAILWASGSADSELRNYVHTYVRTYVRRGAPWPDNLKTARSAVDPQSFLRAGPWAHIQVSGHTRLGLPGPGICDVKALGFKLRRFMRTRVDRAFRDQLPRACVFLFGRGQPGLGTYVHTYVFIRLAWRGRATSKLPGPVRGLRHDGRVVCVCVCASVGHHSWDGPPRSCGAGLGVPAAADRRGGLVGQVPRRGLQCGPPDDSRRGALRSSQTPCPPKVKAGHSFDFRSRRLSGEGVACQDSMRTTCGYVSSHTCAFGAGPTLGDGGRPAYGHRV